MLKSIKRYLKVWWLMSRNSFVSTASQKISFSIFLIGKIIRFTFFFLFLFFLLSGTKTLAGYSSNQIIFFYITFTFIDTLSQFLFREVYRFRPLIVKGDFDYVLAKPVNPLFRALMGGADVIDLVILPPLVVMLLYYGSLVSIGPVQSFFYLIFVLNSLLITTAFHIAVLSLGIITLEVDHTIMIYRDVISLGRFPVDIYKEPLKGFLTYIIPVGIIMTLPGKILMGVTSFSGALVGFALSFVFIFFSLKLWKFALTKYTSASS